MTNSVTLKRESQYTPWTAPWMKIHFNYTGYIINENIIPKSQKHADNVIKHRVAKFAQQRSSYHYSNISSNVRDLGGYLTKDGKHITRKGILIRGNSLNNLNSNQLKALNSSNITKVIDLRTYKMHKAVPDNIRNKIPVTCCPIYTAKGVNRSRNLTFKYGVIYRYRHLFVTNPHALKGYHDSIMGILNNHTGATLFHCTEGRDRTGLLSAILLSILGVDRKTIIYDYLLTNYYCPTRPFIRQYKQIETFFKTIDKKFGGMCNYFHAMKITKHDVKLLCQECLISIH